MASSRTEAPKVVLLFGPTGVGKTDLLGRMFGGRAEVISADAIQVYKGLDIGTAKPDPDLLAALPHHLIDIIDFRTGFSAGEFRNRTDSLIPQILSRGRLPVISGGTAFYLKAWLTGLPETPPSDPGLRRRIDERWAGRSEDEIRTELEKADPLSASRIGAGDRYRLLRALEVYEQTGRPLSSIPVPERPREDYRILTIGLNRDRAELYRRIDTRVDRMIAGGLAAEVAGLVSRGASREHPGMKAIGYREWFDQAEDPHEITTDPGSVRDLIARNTRRYAKRQITFFSSLPGVRWYDASLDSAESGIEKALEEFLSA